MNIVLLTLGSHGDMHPFVGIGRRMRLHGHAVTVVANPHFESLIRAEGLEFEPIGTAEDYQTLTRDPDLWSKMRGFRVVFGNVIKTLGPTYDALVRRITDHTIVVGSSLALAARVAQDKLKFPLATVHLAPGVFRSVYAPPRLPGFYMPRWLPMWIKHRMWDAADDWMIDPVVAAGLNDFRASKGLPPVARPLRDWWHSADMVIGLFPAWFAAKQTDWPAQTHLTGFPLYDESGIEPLPAKLEEFLEHGEPPIAFTPGSAMFHGHEFFDVAVKACVRLGRRGLLLSRHHGHVPAPLPNEVIHIDYAPFSALLPRVAALVHHGGIGTSSQALAAGAPQLVMPMTHDQPDNAARLRALGVAEVVPESRFTTRRAIGALNRLLDDPHRKSRCASVAKRFHGVDSIGETCGLIESLGASGSRSADQTRVAESRFRSV